MTRDQLVNGIKEHEAASRELPGAGFSIIELLELAPGVIAACDDDDEFTLYFDLEISLLPEAPLPDSSMEIPDFAAGVGFIECVLANSFADIAEIARVCLQVDNWHSLPVPVNY